VGRMDSSRSSPYELDSAMSGISPEDASRVSSLLISGNVDDGTLRKIAALRDLPPDLTKNMLMVMSDTPDARIRNILSVALAQVGVKEAVPRILNLGRVVN
jgi:hypothetical protein